jgi:hypothetical protein
MPKTPISSRESIFPIVLVSREKAANCESLGTDGPENERHRTDGKGENRHKHAERITRSCGNSGDSELRGWQTQSRTSGRDASIDPSDPATFWAAFPLSDGDFTNMHSPFGRTMGLIGGRRRRRPGTSNS